MAIWKPEKYNTKGSATARSKKSARGGGIKTLGCGSDIFAEPRSTSRREEKKVKQKVDYHIANAQNRRRTFACCRSGECQDVLIRPRWLSPLQKARTIRWLHEISQIRKQSQYTIGFPGLVGRDAKWRYDFWWVPFYRSRNRGIRARVCEEHLFFCCYIQWFRPANIIACLPAAEQPQTMKLCHHTGQENEMSWLRIPDINRNRSIWITSSWRAARDSILQA